jgi:hypothetical protein
MGDRDDLRRRRLHRRFKAAIVATAVLVAAALVLGTRRGRHAARLLAIAVGLSRTDQERRIGYARAVLGEAYAREPPAVRRLLDLAGLAPGDRLIVPANVDEVLLLSGRVFLLDPSRTYRLRPATRAVWARVPGYRLLLLPDGPEVRRAVVAAGGELLPGSEQSTNSWGCRGREPDPSAEVRVLVLGDSMMQAMLLADHQAPPERLERRLREATGTSCSVLNAGHLGYSPEQYDRTLLEYAGRFRPHCVVLALCANDFRGEDGVASNARWVMRALEHCAAAKVPCLVVPVPERVVIEGTGRDERYPELARLAIRGLDARHWCDPEPDFVEEDLRSRGTARFSRLYNGPLGDGHLSAAGADKWAEVVCRRLRLLLGR